ncbi:hypothetical protein HH214_07945 [Mucilaginibacter robiniae]|uniref:DUF4157 domain-containing protein n=2 Tax=Mucilaginibacter robiniae TaxID=2728022 RepID=A0A7L5E7P6_9SPHI|nr:hypothetical protein HH214_07945 [Mucilaginibacter robiniae]
MVVRRLKVSGMAVYPFILVQKPTDAHDPVIIRHETIHMKQAEELFIIPFYLLYLLNYLFNLYKYRNHDQAYLNIVFEREAYRCERDSTYLQHRRLWAWRFYFK